MEGIAMELKGSKTEQNLIAAFAGESQARNKYTYFASVAKKEGYERSSRKRQIMKKSTPKCGSRNYPSWEIQQRT